MDINDYQQFTRTTDKYPEGTKLLTLALGLAGEAGEVGNELKKVYRDEGGSLTRPRVVRMMDELGDCVWYVARLASELGFSMSDVLAHNVEKLQRRHGK